MDWKQSSLFVIAVGVVVAGVYLVEGYGEKPTKAIGKNGDVRDYDLML